MAGGGRYYFVSDLHLGAEADPGGVREKAFVEYLRSLPSDAKALYLLGDIFDFWIDYRDVVPRGCVRVLAALAEVAWSNDNRTDYDDFVDRIVNGLLPIYDERGYNYAPYAFKDIE